MKKIIVAGAGHGGISAAKTLSENGFDVTVFEANARASLGYDWEDCMVKQTFEECGFSYPGDDYFAPYEKPNFTHPSKKVIVKGKHYTGNRFAYIERKKLIEFIIAEAEAAGVKFVFETEILRCECNEKSVTGIVIKDSTGTKIVRGDLVIDACGLNSPVRKSLPSWFNVKKDISPDECFSTFRTYYKKINPEEKAPTYQIYFFHCNRPGMDWVIDAGDNVDILVGAFGPLTPEQVMEATEDFRKEYPNIGTEIARGGIFAQIPLRRTFPIFTANGYAAVGDSAGMIEPLSGSGINLSLKAGAILAKVLIEHKDEEYTAKVLWDYQYKWFTKNGFNQLQADIIKRMLSSVNGEDIDFMFENGILTQKELAKEKGVKYNFNDICQKATMLKKPKIAAAFAGAGISIGKMKAVTAALPKEYDKDKISAWVKMYESF